MSAGADVPGTQGPAQGVLFTEDTPSMDESIGFRGPTACGAAGVTYRQLDYWARTGLLQPSVRNPSGSGTQRLYSFRDILVLKIIKRLLDTGVSLQQIRVAVNALRDRALAEDCVQETFLRAWRSRESFDSSKGGERTWLFAIARNVIADALRARERLPRTDVPQAALDARRDLIGAIRYEAPFDLPDVLEHVEVDGRTVVVERRLPGRNALEVLDEPGTDREALVRSHLDAAAAIADLPCPTSTFGEVWGAGAIEADTFATWATEESAAL